ncbi:Glucosidase 2 subunit beta [Phytophthora nicotianae]|uniref:Glucosidase 2 subunit beta n=1 Tax=Phytophthora nicotianae TaxID=4792 RepID=A0A0W8CDS5_PHYNI|nr:Glucosidase 2 subunit beta [Phytophthora nicotianae]
MPSRATKRSMLAFLLAMIVAIACMLVLSNQQDNNDIKTDTDESKETCVDSLPIDLVDDDYCDCQDGSDEPNTSACSHVLLHSETPPFGPEFNCKADDKMVSLAFVHDGVCDCCDGSDERDGLCANTCATEWERRLQTLQERLNVVQRGLKRRTEYLAGSVDKVQKLKEDFERLAEAYQSGQRAFEDLQRQAQHNPELRGQLEQSYNVLRRVQYITYIQSRVVDPSTFSDAAWKPAFVELVGECYTYTVNEKELKGGTPNVIPRKYDMVLCPFQNSYNHGEPCANGQERHTRVELLCGEQNRVVSVEEREMCQYEVRFETPAACGQAEQDVLQDEISRVKTFFKTKDVGEFAGHEEL